MLARIGMMRALNHGKPERRGIVDAAKASMARQLPLSPMIRFSRRFRHALDVTVQSRMTPIRANIVGPPFVATRIKASVAACHSGASCSAFGSFVM